MTCWRTRKTLFRRGHTTGYEISPAETFKQASDIDFMLQFGPVRMLKRRPQTEPETLQGNSPVSALGDSNAPEDSNQLHGEPKTVRCRTSNTLQNDPDTHDTVTSQQSKEGSSISLNLLTLSVDEVEGAPGFVCLRVDPQQDGKTRATDTFKLDAIRSTLETLFSGCVEPSDLVTGENPNIAIKLGDDKGDLVPCLLYSEWNTDEFTSRHRPSGQPSRALVERLSKMPVRLVSKAVRKTPGGTDTWRMSFSKHESLVIRAMTKPQRICLVLLKHCAAMTRSPLCSYYLKTAVMWVCERRPRELWTWHGMLDSMEAVLDFLQECSETLVLPCYFAPKIDLWQRENIVHGKPIRCQAAWSEQQYAVLKLRLLAPRSLQLLLAGLLSSSQAPLMRHLLDIPLDAQQFLWCCWRRGVDDPLPPVSSTKLEFLPKLMGCALYPHAVEGRLWSEGFLDTFRWEDLPARCKEPDWFAKHGLDTDSEGEEDQDSEEDRDSEGEGN